LLTFDIVKQYLQTIAERGEHLLRELREIADSPCDYDRLSELAHALAGSAGLFGFERVAWECRHFARAVEKGSVETANLSHRLRSALDATMKEIGYRLAAMENCEGSTGELPNEPSSKCSRVD
jgi:HPt (histidine-containing phosphotransfer) domain-containing protein